MIDTLYIETEIADHPRTQHIRMRFPDAVTIFCERYGEVFNPKAQNFRLQKQQPALILARKHNGFVLPTPSGYGIGGSRNYYFSHMLNCLYDCRYCFLQGMYRSAHYVLFVNYEDFLEEIENTLSTDTKPCWFFSGYDCDSLAFDPVSSFSQAFLPFFAQRPQAHIELRSKSTQIRNLLNMPPFENAVIAFSFTPPAISQALEHKVPNTRKRLEAMQKLQNAGWRLGLRFDPLIYQQDYQTHYRALFADVFSALKFECLHSVSFGAFRLPKTFHKNILRLYPDEPLFAGPLEDNHGMVSYHTDLEREMRDFCRDELLRYIPESLLFPCLV